MRFITLNPFFGILLKVTGCALVAMPFNTATAQTMRQPIASIADAKWEDYKDMYEHSPICGKEEVTLWSCKVGRKVYSVCSTPSVSKDSGYIQYRAAKNGRIDFNYPSTKGPPAGHFSYHTSANGDAYLDFTNDGYQYRLGDPLRAASMITLSKGNRSTEIACENGNQSLQNNYTMRLMWDSELWNGK